LRERGGATSRFIRFSGGVLSGWGKRWVGWEGWWVSWWVSGCVRSSGGRRLGVYGGMQRARLGSIAYMNIILWRMKEWWRYRLGDWEGAKWWWIWKKWTQWKVNRRVKIIGIVIRYIVRIVIRGCCHEDGDLKIWGNCLLWRKVGYAGNGPKLAF